MFSRGYKSQPLRPWRQRIAVFFLLGLAGCSIFGQKDPAPVELPKHLAILLSDESSAFQRVAKEIIRQYGKPVESFRLKDVNTTQEETLRRLQRSPATRVVAIGLPAARAARRLTGKQIVFCQVSSHEEANLISASMKGVRATPPVSEQFRVWRALNPKLRTVGVITGPQQTALLAEANQAAREQGLTLIAVQVKADRETLYAFKQLARRVQGLWLVPDNRVLSGAVLRDLMAYAVMEGKQVLAFSQELLSLGALLSMESSPEDIASRVLARTREAPTTKIEVMPLTRAETRVNTMMLRRFGLKLPNGFEGKPYAS